MLNTLEIQHPACVLHVFIVKHFKTLIFCRMLPFPHDFKNPSLEGMNICKLYWKKGTYSENVPYL